MNNKILIIAIVLSILLLVPLIFQLSPGGGSCLIDQTNAQENPCLAQEATLSAVQLSYQQVAFDATVDAINYQSTVESLENNNENLIATVDAQQVLIDNQASVVSSTPSNLSVGLPFSDTFDDNRNGWDLLQAQGGSISFSGDKLAVTADPYEEVVIEVPNVILESDFYAEVQVELESVARGGWISRTAQRMMVGFALGNDNDTHKFVVGPGEGCCYYMEDAIQFVRIIDNQEEVISRSYADRVSITNQSFTLGLRAQRGLYSVFIDGVATESVTLFTHGSRLSLIVLSSGDEEGTAYFDNLEIQEAE